jgi:hypothetical protein
MVNGKWMASRFSDAICFFLTDTDGIELPDATSESIVGFNIKYMKTIFARTQIIIS